MKFRTLRVSAAIVAALTFLAGAPIAAQPSAPDVTPRIYGGTPATGNPGVAFLGIKTSTVWDRVCSAVVWKPRVLLTAAHCVTPSNSSGNVNEIAVFPPGAAVTLFRNIGPQGAAPVSVTGIWKPAGFMNASSQVEANDFAVLLLDSDLGPQYFTRLATSAEMSRWADQLFPATVLGYGLTGVNQFGNVPMQATIPIDTYEPNSNFGPVFSITQSPTAGICSGDSGGPTFATNSQGERLVLGVNAGSAGGCTAFFDRDYLMVGFTAINFLDLVNAAMVAAGYPAVPSAPTNIELTARNSSIIVSWSPPATAPESVTGYEVVDPAGVVVCTSVELTCEVTNLPPGEHSFTVRSRNTQGEGNALAPVASARVIPPGQPAPPRVQKKRILIPTLAGKTSAVVTAYRIVDVQGRTICTVRNVTPERSTLRCPTPTKPGIYRFRTIAETQMGQSVPSGLSRKIKIS